LNLQVVATGSSGNCYALHDNGKILLLDAGIPADKILQAIRFRTPDVVGCLITHKHLDHIKGAEKLNQRGVKFYGAIETQQAVPFMQTSSGAFTLGQFKALSFKVEHCNPNGTDCPNHGWIITNNRTSERMVYITDTCTLHNTFPGIHYWLIECNYMDEMLDGSPPMVVERLPHSHMSVSKLKAVFAANDLRTCKQIVLCHGSSQRLNPEAAKKAIQEATGKPVEVASAGMNIPLELDPF